MGFLENMLALKLPICHSVNEALVVTQELFLSEVYGVVLEISRRTRYPLEEIKVLCRGKSALFGKHRTNRDVGRYVSWREVQGWQSLNQKSRYSLK